ncbi:YeiH family protein [Adlercreutzia sp. ZJ141]|uniref:YeiH family protein n=1 Tax=Adlercreutzia sp. ZJ141 TaxID=2709406 RepID=UPI0013EA15FA|nr:YeiH family protein [Adlercreutzia sp. ZJ141]
MNFIRNNAGGIGICAIIALPCWFLGQAFPIVGGPVFAILAGMAIALLWKPRARGTLQKGIGFTAKKVLQYAVILLGFGLNLIQIAQVGAMSLPIICSTIATALIVAFLMSKALHMPAGISTLIGVGSSICGGSAIAATAPVINAKDEDVAQAISVIFLFNVVAALVFPTLGNLLGMSNDGFGLFAGTAVNDTSSVTAAAAAWDGMHPGSNALDHATIVKLTRTLAIIPITLVLALLQVRKAKRAAEDAGSAGVSMVASDASASEVAGDSSNAVANANNSVATTASDSSATRQTGGKQLGNFSLKRAFPMFILWFVVASIITTIAVAAGADAAVFDPLKTLSKFFICMAMAAIGLNTDIVKLVKSGGKPILMGFVCWICIAAVSLGMQALLGLW